MKDDLLRNSEIFKILSNPVRLCILTNLVMNKSRNVSELVMCSNVSQSLVSQQLAKLRLSGIISSKKVGNEVYYEIKDEKIIEIIKMINKK